MQKVKVKGHSVQNLSESRRTEATALPPVLTRSVTRQLQARNAWQSPVRARPAIGTLNVTQGHEIWMTCIILTLQYTNQPCEVHV